MTITADWQIERGSLLLGAGTDYDIVTPPGPQGLIGSPSVRSGDVDLMGDGSSPGRDLLSSRLITIPVNVHGGDAAWANEAIRDLMVAWRRTSVEVPLDVRIPGQPETVLRYFGRCRGVSEQAWTLLYGDVGLLLAFAALDPFAYGAEVTSAVDTASPLTIPAASMGDVGTVTDRAVLTVVAPGGGKPTITNTTTGGVIAFASNVSGTYTLDLHDQTATKSGVNRDGDLTASSSWFNLRGGVNNVLTFTGATSIQVTHRPAYEVI